MNLKTEGREYAFKFLFDLVNSKDGQLKELLDVLPDSRMGKILPLIEDFESLLRYEDEENPTTLPKKKSIEFGKTLIFSTLQVLENLSNLLIPFLDNWDYEKLENVDRTLLLMAVAELKIKQDAPPKVVINEYINLSKKFGGEKSGAFINKVLDNVLKRGQ